MFQLTKEEDDSLRFQIGMSKQEGRGGRRYLPYAFTEQGVAMLSSVLNSERAIQVNIEIMRAFVRLKQMLASNAELARKLSATLRPLRSPGAGRSGSMGIKKLTLTRCYRKFDFCRFKTYIENMNRR